MVVVVSVVETVAILAAAAATTAATATICGLVCLGSVWWLTFLMSTVIFSAIGVFVISEYGKDALL